MPTINQLMRKPRVKPLARNKVPALEKQPLKRAVCIKYRALANISDYGGQEVPHLHFHLFGGEKVGKMVS